MFGAVDDPVWSWGKPKVGLRDYSDKTPSALAEVMPVRWLRCTCNKMVKILKPDKLIVHLLM